MRLREIPNLLSGIKIKKVKWASDTWIFFNGVRWIDEEQNTYPLVEVDEFAEWEISQMQQKKNKHKFWLWAFREKSDYDCIFSINAIFFDEMLRDTSGSKLEDLEGCEYIKLPHTEIEVEVDW